MRRVPCHYGMEPATDLDAFEAMWGDPDEDEFIEPDENEMVPDEIDPEDDFDADE